jgi:hypothetical protein
MPRAPRPGDFIPKHCIEDLSQHRAILTTAENQTGQKNFARWGSRNDFQGLRYTKRGYWAWDAWEKHGTEITPEDILGPEPLVPGSWVERKDPNKQWDKRWLIGFTSEGRPVTEHPKFPCKAIVNDVGQIRPYRDAEQRAIDKLKDDGHIVTKEMTRTVKVLNTLGLLKD